MEGKDYNKTLTDEDIDYMFNIINSDISEDEKAKKLYFFCKEKRIQKNILNVGWRKREIRLKKLNDLLSVYQDYSKRGLFDFAKNNYACTFEEMELRINNLKTIYDKIVAKENDYSIASLMFEYYQKPELLKRKYTWFIRRGENDPKLEPIRDALNNLDLIVDIFKKYEQTGVIDDVNYYLNIKKYYECYDYAKFVINNYIESNDSYKENEFVSNLGINKEILDFCARAIEELDVELFKKYKEKKDLNYKIRCFKLSITLSNLSQGIKTGYLPNGTPFDLFEFINRVPFKNSKNFVEKIEDFMSRNNPYDLKVIMNYIYKNNLNLYGAFKPMNLKYLYDTKIKLNGIEITNHDNDIILEYLRLNNIPIIESAYFFARSKYLNGEFNSESVKKLNEEKYLSNNNDLNKSKAKILIPYNNNIITNKID